MRKSEHNTALTACQATQTRQASRFFAQKIFLSPGLKSDILHGKTGCKSRNLPLQRISVAVTLNYNTTRPHILQVFFKIFYVIFVEFCIRFLFVMLRVFHILYRVSLSISSVSSALIRHYTQLPTSSPALTGRKMEFI